MIDPIERLEELMGRAPDFPDEIMPEDDGSLDCPCCGGDGVVDAEWVQHARSNSWPGGVQFYGVGHEHQWAEEFYLALRSAAPALLAVARAAQRLNDEGLTDAGGNYIALGRYCEELGSALAALQRLSQPEETSHDKQR